MDELNFDNILGEQEIDTLFTSPEDSSPEEETKEEEAPKTEERKEEKNDTAEADPEELFDGQPEGVGGEDDEGKEDASTDRDSGTSPNNFYSSIANALAVDGVFPNLNDETIKGANDAESFSDLIEAEVEARLDDKQKRISKALDNGVSGDDIRKYENTLGYINSITNVQLMEESDKGEQLRRNLIYQDFLNKGYTPDKAQKFTERTIDAGTDIEDAKEALQSNKEFFGNAYNKLLREAQQRIDQEAAERKKQDAKLKDSLLKDKTLMGGYDVSSSMRQKAYENISKPVYRDPDTGEYYTALQRYEMEHRADFLKYTGLIFTLTNGFKDFDSFAKGKVKREVRRGLRDLERTLNSTSRDSNGNLRMVTNVKDDPYSYIGKGIKLDL